MRGSERLKRFVDASTLGALLESNGFRVQRLNHCRSIGDTVQVVQFQASQFSNADSVDFTVNVGVALRPLWRVECGAEIGREVHESDCFPRFRIGQAMGGFQAKVRDRWWSVTEADAHPDVVAELRQALEGLVVPLLDRLTNLQEIAAFVDTEAPPRYPHIATRISWAILCGLNGQHSRSKEMLDELEADPRVVGEWRTRIEEVRKRLSERAGP